MVGHCAIGIPAVSLLSFLSLPGMVSAQSLPGINLPPITIPVITPPVLPVIPPVEVPLPDTLFEPAIQALAGGGIVLQLLDAPPRESVGLVVQLLNTDGVNVNDILQTLDSFQISVPVLDAALAIANAGLSVFDNLQTGLSVNLANTATLLDDVCRGFNSAGSEQAISLLEFCFAIDQLNLTDLESAARLLANVALEEAFVLVDSLVTLSDTQTSNIHSRLDALRRQSAVLSNQSRFTATGVHNNQGVNNTVLTAASGGAASSDLVSRLGGFINAQSSTGELDGGVFQQDSEFSANTVTLGIDYRLSNELVVGVASGLLQDDSTFTNVRGGAQAEGFNLSAFASWYESDEGYVDLVLDTGQTDFELQRNISIIPSSSLTALSSTASKETSFTINGGRNFRPFGQFDLGAYFQLAHTRANVDGYTETLQEAETNFVPLFSVGKQSAKSSKVLLGLEVSKAYSLQSAIVLPTLRLEYVRESELNKEPIEATETNTGVVVQYIGQDRVPSYSNLGFGVSAVLKRGTSVYAYYETLLRHKLATRDIFKIGIRMEF